METISDNRIIIRPIRHFDLYSTFESGQAFRWERVEEGHYVGVAMGKVLHVKRAGDSLILEPATAQEYETVWKPYLGLDRDYDKIHRHLGGRDEHLDQALAFSDGLRLLKQDPWETTVSFIISANNNILRIRKIIKELSRRYGTPLDAGFHAFPSPEQLAEASLEDLRDCGLGYRDRYVLEAALRVSRGETNLDALQGKPDEEIEKTLLELPGVGPKVAQCILLFAYGISERVPVDTWIQRIVRELYQGRMREGESVGAFFLRMFGEDSGYAQQALFHWARHQQWNR